MNWLQLRFSASGEHTDAVGAILEAAGAAAVTVIAADDEVLLEPAPGEVPLWRYNSVSGLFPGDQDPARLRARLEAALAGFVESPGSVEELEDQDWLNAWREQAPPRCFADGCWILPTDAEVPAGARVVVRLDPGLAFGSGAHATTALCLGWLGRQDLHGRRVIDYGCGSGILAIAAAALGAREVIAVDYDPQALIATSANAGINGVRERIQICAPGQVPPEPADCLVANILANALYDLYEELRRLASPGAALALSGVLASQADRLLQRYRQGFIMEAPQSLDDWLLLQGRRR